MLFSSQVKILQLHASEDPLVHMKTLFTSNVERPKNCLRVFLYAPLSLQLIAQVNADLLARPKYDPEHPAVEGTIPRLLAVVVASSI